jgi:hypothetical protein
MQDQKITRPDAQSRSFAAVLVLIAIVLLSIGRSEFTVSKLQLKDALVAASILRVDNDTTCSGTRANLLRLPSVHERKYRKMRKAHSNDGKYSNIHQLIQT